MKLSKNFVRVTKNFEGENFYVHLYCIVEIKQKQLSCSVVGGG